MITYLPMHPWIIESTKTWTTQLRSGGGNPPVPSLPHHHIRCRSRCQRPFHIQVWLGNTSWDRSPVYPRHILGNGKLVLIVTAAQDWKSTPEHKTYPLVKLYDSFRGLSFPLFHQISKSRSADTDGKSRNITHSITCLPGWQCLGLWTVVRVCARHSHKRWRGFSLRFSFLTFWFLSFIFLSHAMSPLLNPLKADSSCSTEPLRFALQNPSVLSWSPSLTAHLFPAGPRHPPLDALLSCPYPPRALSHPIGLAL